MDDIIGTIGI